MTPTECFTESATILREALISNGNPEAVKAAAQVADSWAYLGARVAEAEAYERGGL